MLMLVLSWDGLFSASPGAEGGGQGQDQAGVNRALGLRACRKEA